MDTRVARKTRVKRVRYIAGVLSCQRCTNSFDVRELNPERKTVPCPVCGNVNDIQGARNGSLLPS